MGAVRNSYPDKARKALRKGAFLKLKNVPCRVEKIDESQPGSKILKFETNAVIFVS